MRAALRCAMRRGHGPTMLEAAAQTDEDQQTNEDSTQKAAVAQTDEDQQTNEDSTQRAEAWARIVRGLRRLARLRRLWAVMGHWLNEVKRRGR